MNRWLTWRARLEHLLHPSYCCLCHVCAAERARRQETLQKKIGAELTARKTDLCNPPSKI